MREFAEGKPNLRRGLEQKLASGGQREICERAPNVSVNGGLLNDRSWPTADKHHLALKFEHTKIRTANSRRPMFTIGMYGMV